MTDGRWRKGFACIVLGVFTHIFMVSMAVVACPSQILTITGGVNVCGG